MCQKFTWFVFLLFLLLLLLIFFIIILKATSGIALLL
jgi:hypothetical protein